MVSRAYVIVVVDDDLNGSNARRQQYEDVFGNCAMFKLKYIDRPDDLSKIKTEHADGYLIDMFLERWGGLRASDVMKNYIAYAPHPAPIFLVSARWGEPEVMEELKRVTELGEVSQRGERVKHYFSWDEFSIEGSNQLSPHVAERTRRKLQMEMDLWQGRSYAQVGDGDTVRILHVSDMQYGDPEMSGDCRLDDETIGRYLLNNNMSPDIVAITGDIAYSGCPSEYRKSQLGIEQLLASVFDCGTEVDSFRERVLLVPGNHDANLRMASCAHYRYSSFEPSSEKPILERGGVPSQEMVSDYDDYGWKPFREFASKLTRDRQWLDPMNRSLCSVSNRFVHWGIQFVPINTVRSLNCQAPSTAGLSEGDLRPLEGELRHDGSLFRIALGHHGREEMGSYSEHSSWQLLASFMARNKVQLFLHGHRHESKGDYCKDQCFGGNTLNISMASTLTLNRHVRREGSLRGFTIVELNRDAGRVVGGKIISFEIRDTKVSRNSETKILMWEE